MLFRSLTPAHHLGENGVLLFADCAVNPCPDARELAQIAVTTAETARSLAGLEPKVAMLSFSTKGSAKHELIDKVTEATRIAKELAPKLEIDGELQADAALIAPHPLNTVFTGGFASFSRTMRRFAESPAASSLM